MFTAEENQTAIRSYAQVKTSPHRYHLILMLNGISSAYPPNPFVRPRMPPMLPFYNKLQGDVSPPSTLGICMTPGLQSAGKSANNRAVTL